MMKTETELKQQLVDKDQQLNLENQGFQQQLILEQQNLKNKEKQILSMNIKIETANRISGSI